MKNDVDTLRSSGSRASAQEASSIGSASNENFLLSPPGVSLPKGGGAMRGIGEKFTANPVTGTGSMSVPIALSPGRSGFGPQLSLSYDSGVGNSVFGLGWQLALPSISRKTDKGLPRYADETKSDVFLLSGAEDLVPVSENDKTSLLAGKTYRISNYRPRVEGLFVLIERWVEVGHEENCFWRSISRDNITTWYGRDAQSRIFDPDYATRIFQWLICQTHDDKGNVCVYRYIGHENIHIDTTATWESNRLPQSRLANRYLKRILYGNRKPFLPSLNPANLSLEEPTEDWMFEAVFDYGDHNLDAPLPQPDQATPNPQWPARIDTYSQYRAGFEIRTERLCRRVLMFHHFPEDSAVGADCLVRSTDFEYLAPDNTEHPAQPGYTMLRTVTQRSYQKAAATDTSYQSRQLPPVNFTYSKPIVNSVVQTIDASQLDNLPIGTQGSGYRWLDLDGEGLSGVLAQALGGWYYKPNLGDGVFGPLREVAPMPMLAMAAGSRIQFMDLAGDGEIDVVDFDGATPGFHERDRDSCWKRHIPFLSLPNIDWQDPNLRFVDLTGDGHADALMTEQEVFTWYPSLDERGFAAAEQTRLQIDEDSGPRLVFADGTQTVFLADMCGDGLTDLLRIRNGEVCYWPNLGYGRFGRKVSLGNAPRFDHLDLFDPNRIRLADIDGSGPIDIIYLGRNGASLYFNRSGNSLSNPLSVDLPVATENLAAVQVADLLGNGTACLVWNSHLPADALRPVCYIDLMGGPQSSTGEKQELRKHEKPHLLILVENNLGATTEIEYTPSTRFYLQDQLAGSPWVTRLPFPVHCVSRVIVHDLWRGTTFSSTYSYHHGYFDGIEREFRGFGRVEQVDVEDYGGFTAQNAGSPWITADQTLYQPPVKTVTWYHTGAALDRQRLLSQFEHEYFPQRFADRLSKDADAFHEKPMPEPVMPADLRANEWREALRACKGMVLRQEIYELDLQDLTAHSPKHTPVRLYSSATHNCNIQLLQARGDNLHAVFLVTESEALSYHYELPIPKDDTLLQPDPRIAHTLNLRHDELGNPQQSIAIGYPRWKAGDYGELPNPELIAQVQSERHIAYNEAHYTQDVILNAAIATDSPIRHHRLRLPFEMLNFELVGIPQINTHYYTLADFLHLHLSKVYGPQPGDTVPPIEVTVKQYHEVLDGKAPQMRLVEYARSRYFNDAADDAPPDPNNPLAFGLHGPRGLKYEDYKLALTTGLLNAVFKQADTSGKIDDKLAWEIPATDRGQPATNARNLLDDANHSGYWAGPKIGMHPNEYWMRSGTAGFASDAHQHFFLPERYTDPFGNVTTLAYDELDLFIQSSTDAKDNVTGIALDKNNRPRFDYRVLAPIEMVDANGNHSEAVFDIRGQPVAMAIKGKQVNGVWQGDHLDGWSFEQINLPEAELAAFCVSRDFGDAQEQIAREWLASASSRFIYHFGETWDTSNQPNWMQRMAGACAISRETHVGALPTGEVSQLQIALECSDGSGAVLMKKAQAEPDPASAQQPPPRRWLINGLTVLNNKGKPVKQYEPTFTDRFGCELPQANGVTALIYYDAAGRPIRTEYPDGAFSRVEFSPWQAKTWDQNDTAFDPQGQQHSDWYRRRTDPTHPRYAEFNSPENSRAAALVQVHADTPALTILDSLGREVIAIAHNRQEDANGDYQVGGKNYRNAYYTTFTKLDAEGKPLWICDARGNLVMQYITPPKPNHTPLYDSTGTDWRPAYDIPPDVAPCYDIAGNLLFQHSMDAGDRWTLNDAVGKPMFAWDIYKPRETETTEEKRLYSTAYDALHRPIALWLTKDNAILSMVERYEYQDTQNPDGTANPLMAQLKTANLLGQLVKHFDPSGLVETIALDFKGSPLQVQRRLVSAKTSTVSDWQADLNPDGTAKLETETFTQITEYDALKRMTKLFNWHCENHPVAVYLPAYSERGVLKSEALVVGATKTSDGYSGGQETQAISEIRYDAKGQRQYLKLGNGVITTYHYDQETFRLMNLHSERATGETCGGGLSSAFVDGRSIQDLHYSYDPVGNITEIADSAFKTVYFDNQEVKAVNRYEYDALYRLIAATGRENGAASGAPANIETDPLINQFPCVADNAFRNYTQRYQYDPVGNILQMAHAAGATGSWTRRYQYAFEDSQQAASNRLWRTWHGSDTWDGGDASNKVSYAYDSHGSMLNLANVADEFQLQWDHRDMIGAINLGGGGFAHYQYDTSKQRTRKWIERSQQNTVEERIYLGGLELYRRWLNGAKVEEIETLHLFDGEQRLLLVDQILETDNTSLGKRTLYRYTLSNHLGSSTLELDEQAGIISYEEYHPYGTSAYRAGRNAAEVKLKRYRYTGMERDEESGLAYHSARFYFFGTCRWITCDPLMPRSSLHSYEYCTSSPIARTDINGLEDSETKIVNPGVRRLLSEKNISFATEVTFDVLNEDGKKIVGGRWDIIFRDPRSEANGGFVVPETKGIDLDKLTEQQRIYVDKMESLAGVTVRITSLKGGTLSLSQGMKINISAQNYVRVGMENFEEFADALESITSGKRIVGSWLSSTETKFFTSVAERESFLKAKGMQFTRQPKAGEGNHFGDGLAGARTAGRAIGLGLAAVGGISEASAPKMYYDLWKDNARLVSDPGAEAARKLYYVAGGHRSSSYPSVSLGDGLFFSPKTGSLFSQGSDIEDRSTYGKLVLIDSLAKNSFGIFYSSTSRRMIAQDETSWTTGFAPEQGVVDYIFESARTWWHGL